MQIPIWTVVNSRKSARCYRTGHYNSKATQIQQALSKSLTNNSYVKLWYAYRQNTWFNHYINNGSQNICSKWVWLYYKINESFKIWLSFNCSFPVVYLKNNLENVNKTNEADIPALCKRKAAIYCLLWPTSWRHKYLWWFVCIVIVTKKSQLI